MYFKGVSVIFFFINLKLMSLFYAYTPFKNSSIDKLHVAAGEINVSMEKEIKA